MFPGIPAASDQWWGDHQQTRVFLCDSIVTGLYWIYDYRSVNISIPSIIHLLLLYLTQQRNYFLYKVVENIYYNLSVILMQPLLLS